MKRCHLLSFLWLVFAVFSSCSHEIELVDLRTEALVDSQDSLNTTVLFSAKADTASVTVHSDGKWKVEAVNDRASSWLTFSPEKGGKGDTRVKIDVTENDEYEERSAVLHFRSGKKERIIQVVQKPYKAFLVSSEKAEFGPSGGKFEVKVTSNVAYSMSIEDAPWLHQIITKGVVNVLEFQVDPTDRADKRIGRLVFTSELGTETVMVYQTGVSPEMVLSANDISVPSEGCQIRVDVSSNFNAEYSISADWVHEIATKAVSTNTFYFYVERNPEYDARTAEIVFFDAAKNLSGTVTIHQAQQDAIVIQNELKIDYKPQVFNLTVGSNVDVTMTIPEQYDWLVPVKTRGYSENTLSFSVAKNNSKEIREADIIFTSGDLRQSVRVVQMPTTHYPKTKADWSESAAMTYSIGRKKELLFSEYDPSAYSIEFTVNALMEFDEIVDAFVSPDESVVSVMQRDSMLVNLALEEVINPQEADEDRIKEMGKSLKRLKEYASQLGEKQGGKKGKALILAPFDRDFHKPLDDWYDLLDLYFQVDSFKNSRADIRFFTGDFLSQYNFILIDTHGNSGRLPDAISGSTPWTSILSSGTVYTDGMISELREEGIDSNVLFIHQGSTIPYLCMKPGLLGDSRLDGSCVILSACKSAKRHIDINPFNDKYPMVDRFIQNGAVAVAGTKKSMSSIALKHFVNSLLYYLSNGLSYQKAFDYSVKTNRAIEWKENVYEKYQEYEERTSNPAGGPLDRPSYDLENILSKPDEPVEDYFFYDQSITLSCGEISEKGVPLSWTTNRPVKANLFTDFIWERVESFWDEPDKKGVMTQYYRSSNVDYHLSFEYDLYVDDKPVDKQYYYSDFSATWPITSSGKHNAYVIVSLKENGVTLASYRSNTVSFMITNIKVMTGQVKDITIKSASVPANYESNHSFEIQEQGVVFSSTNTEPTLIGSGCSKQKADKIGNPFTTSLSGLEPLTRYYVRAYLIVGMDEMSQIIYGNVRSFSTDPMKNMIPEDILDKMDDHMPIYEGITPPNVEGQFLISPLVITYDGTNQYSIGHVFTDLYFQFMNQDMENNTLDYKEKAGNSSSTGTGAFISGEGDKFSVFFNTDGVNVYSDSSVNYKQALVISGIMTPEGIKDIYYAFVMLSKGSDPYHHVIDVGGFRVFKDSDGLSVSTNYFNGSTQSKTREKVYNISSLPGIHDTVNR